MFLWIRGYITLNVTPCPMPTSSTTTTTSTGRGRKRQQRPARESRTGTWIPPSRCPRASCTWSVISSSPLFARVAGLCSSRQSTRFRFFPTFTRYFRRGPQGRGTSAFLAPVAHAPRSIACAPVSVLAAPVGPEPVVEADPQFTAPGKTDHVLEKSYEQKQDKKTRSTRGGRGGLTHPSPPPPTLFLERRRHRQRVPRAGAAGQRDRDVGERRERDAA